MPDGTKIKKPAPINLIPEDDDDSSRLDDDYDDNSDEEEDAPAPEESLNSVLSGPKNWILPSGANVNDIVAGKLSANAIAIKKKRISASEKATLRYGSSRIIDLSTNMRDWFSVDDRKFMMKDHKAVLQVPCMTSEENSFVATVEDVCAIFQI